MFALKFVVITNKTQPTIPRKMNIHVSLLRLKMQWLLQFRVSLN